MRLLTRVVVAATLLLGLSAAGPDGLAGQETVAVAARDLARGTVLRPEDIAREAPAAPGATDSGEVGEGWVVRRLVRQGEVLRSPAVAPPSAVRAGEPVQGVVRRGVVELRVWGVALNDAPVGGIVHLRTADGRRFTGTATGIASATLAIREKH